ncbi:hypothetical protein SAMN04487910_0383 [Aquimarina amphilecti]|uniref:Uncharacterized protein n=1 Tax=Aquimarina amphilecti TaxID=1038014 RepID=A0A1H7GI98_AQUAM|nr:hypothetical protein [Aquimarina amphilecti]SEK37809.1 hypothetical protein SAMN04487910_0383 [Aquimarina amphilecti]
MGRATFDNFQDKFLTIEFPTVVEPFPWDVTREGEDITFTLGAGEDEKSEVHKTTDVRKFLFENFNWNGIVHFMHLLSDKNDNFTYTRPTDLKGIPADDDILIIPDEATEAIIYEQAKYAIETTYADAPADNIDNILNDVDGKAKTDFSSDILETTYEDLLKEEDNTAMEYDGQSFAMVNLQTASETELYDFLKNVMLARNGLWLEEDGLMNLVSIRREMVTSTTEDVGFNDSMILAWKDGGVKKIKQYIATTEPWKINKKNGKMLPQTTNMFLGLHKFVSSKVIIPAFRSKNVYRKKPQSDDNKLESNDKGLDIHFKLISNRKPVGIPTAVDSYGVAYNRNNVDTYYGDDREAYLTVVKIYKILSDWGAGNTPKSISCYKNLENYTKDFTLSGVLGSTDTDKKIQIKDGENVEKNIKLSSYQAYVGAKYASNKNDAVKLLMYHHEQSNDGTLESSYDDTAIADVLKELKKEEVFESIVKLQFHEEKNFDNVDGQPGGGTITKLNRTTVQKTNDTNTYNEKVNKATTDLNEITNAFAVWDTNTVLPEDLKNRFQNTVKMVANDLDSKAVTTIDNFGGKEIDDNVSGWSTGCQVIPGVQEFFHFMYDITKYIDSTNQERWYYTIIESSSLGITLN